MGLDDCDDIPGVQVNSCSGLNISELEVVNGSQSCQNQYMRRAAGNDFPQTMIYCEDNPDTPSMCQNSATLITTCEFLPDGPTEDTVFTTGEEKGSGDTEDTVFTTGEGNGSGGTGGNSIFPFVTGDTTSTDTASTNSQCYEIIDETYNYTDHADKFSFVCSDTNASYEEINAETGERACVITETVETPVNWSCPASVTVTTTGGPVVYDNIEFVPGVPNECPGGNDSNGVSTCADPDSGAPLNGWEVEPSCRVVPPTYSTCPANVPP